MEQRRRDTHQPPLSPSEGSTGRAIVIVYMVLTFYNFVSHANVPLGFGRGSWLWNSPQYHRLHHAAAAEYSQDVVARQARPPLHPRSGGLAVGRRAFRGVTRTYRAIALDSIIPPGSG